MKISDDFGVEAIYEYNSNNKIKSINYPNGVYKDFEYDTEGNLDCEIDGK